MAPVLTDNPKENRILAALSSEEFARLQDDLDLFHLELGQVLFDPGTRPRYVYFPTTAIVSLIFATEDGSSAELAIAGNDGLVGIPLILGGHSTTHRAVVQSAGNAFRLKSDLMRWELDQGGSLLPLTLRYTQALMTQMAQSVVCNRHHCVVQQLCRWILRSLDRLPGNQLDMTQDQIANMLGVRREAVTDSAGKLQAAGLIQYRRGHITVIDRPGIEARACECYAVVKQEQERLSRLAPEIRARDQARPTLATLRERAETRLQEQGTPPPSLDVDAITQVHELQVHQVEVEMQLEELQRSSIEANALRDRYADIYDFAPVGYFTLNGQGEITELNLAGAILLGIKRSDKCRHRFCNALISECQPEFNRFLAEVLKAKKKKVCEVVLLPTRHRPESIMKIEAVADENGDECRMVVLDVSAERQAAKLLAEREHYLRTLLDNLPFMVWLQDDQSRFLAVNKICSDEFGWLSPQLIVGKSDVDTSPADLAYRYQADDSKIMANRASLTQEELFGADGEHQWIETYNSAVVIDGQRLGTIGYARNITESKAVESTLQKSDDLHRSVLNAVPTEIAVIDSNGVILKVNEHWQNFATTNGIPSGTPAPNTDVGTNYLTICKVGLADNSPGALAAYDGITAVLEGQVASFRMEYQCDSPEQHRWFSMTVTPLIQNENVGAVITHTDISEGKQLELQVREQVLQDKVTRLPNLILFKDRLRQAMVTGKRSNHYGALLLIELDKLEQANETYGNEVCDQLLTEAAIRIRRCVRETDTVARFGDAEFAVILSELNENKESSIGEAGRIAEKIRTALSVPYLLNVARAGEAEDLVEQLCTVSIGVSMFPGQEASQGNILGRAGQSRQQAKMAGGNAVRFCDA